ncbi:MAG: hypothetical protein QG673_196 [Pseudomonadota bacterium]|nr:hypothetical protein [Pseudomonadota bacterium]
MNEARLSLKEFTEKYTQILNSLSHDELKSIISAMAEETLPSDRHTFLNKVTLHTHHSFPTSNDNNSSESPIIAYEDDILDDIEALKEEIESRSSDEPDWEDYDDEDSLSGYDDLVPEISVLLDKVEALYDYGNYALARIAYHRLFAIFSIEDDYGRGVKIDDIPDIEASEVIAKALRSIYLCETSNTRVNAILEDMHEYRSHSTITLKDLIGISIEPLPEFDQFLNLWVEALNSTTDFSEYNDTLLREAVFLQNGINGLENLAKTNGVNHPRIFLDWIDELIKNNKYTDGIVAANYALEVLAKDKPIRAAIADKLSYCGNQVNKSEIADMGVRISFDAKPDLAKLVLLFHQSIRLNKHALLLNAINTIKSHIDKPYHGGYSFEPERPARPTQALLMYAYLLSGEIGQAFNLARVHKYVGWSSGENPQPIFVAYCLLQTAISASQSIDKLPLALQQFLNSKLDSKILAIHKQLNNSLCTPEMIDWCLKVTEDRVIAIVSNQHRSAYSRVALLTAACAEAIKFTNRVDAVAFFTRIQGKYPRHPAFQAEMKKFIRSITEKV